jgi:peroxiredoxin Q/BCP
MAIQVGERAPDIKTPEFNLRDVRGKYVVLYFYPKSDTPGCTREACAFRDLVKDFQKKDAIIVGVSPDKPAAQQKFAAKYGLPFTLVADPEHHIAEAYGVWKEKSLYGRKYMGIERTTFIIDPHGKIAHVFPKVKVDGHALEVLKVL